MADAAVYDATGTLTDIHSKILLLPHLKAAGTCRGNLVPLMLMEAALEDYASWDDFRPNAPAVFEAVDQLMARLVPGRLYEFTLVGWSDERNRAELIFHATHDDFPTSWSRGGPTLLTDFMVPRGPGLGDALKTEPIDFDPVEHGLPAFEVSHRTLADLHCGQKPEPLMAYSVGGFVQCATISRDGIRSQILKNWPNEIGRPILPTEEAAPCLTA
jgi:hypothetical protein